MNKEQMKLSNSWTGRVYLIICELFLSETLSN